MESSWPTPTLFKVNETFIKSEASSPSTVKQLLASSLGVRNENNSAFADYQFYQDLKVIYDNVGISQIELIYNSQLLSLRVEYRFTPPTNSKSNNVVKFITTREHAYVPAYYRQYYTGRARSFKLILQEDENIVHVVSSSSMSSSPMESDSVSIFTNKNRAVHFRRGRVIEEQGVTPPVEKLYKVVAFAPVANNAIRMGLFLESPPDNWSILKPWILGRELILTKRAEIDLSNQDDSVTIPYAMILQDKVPTDVFRRIISYLAPNKMVC